MRRLLLLAILIVVPATAKADGLPGTSYYPLGGCSVTGVCYSVERLYPFSDYGYIAHLTCTNTADCSWITSAYVNLYDYRGDLVFRYGTGNPAADFLNTNVPVWGVLEITPVINHTPIGFERVFLTTPEPGTMALLGTGLVALAGAARRRKAIA